jgi:hypothetical protein
VGTSYPRRRIKQEEGGRFLGRQAELSREGAGAGTSAFVRGAARLRFGFHRGQKVSYAGTAGRLLSPHSFGGTACAGLMISGRNGNGRLQLQTCICSGCCLHQHFSHIFSLFKAGKVVIVATLFGPTTALMLTNGPPERFPTSDLGLAKDDLCGLVAGRELFLLNHNE